MADIKPQDVAKAASTTPANVIIDSVTGLIKDIGSIFTKFKELNVIQQIEEWAYNSRNTEIRGAINQKQWDTLAQMNGKDSTTGMAVVGLLVLMVVVVYYTKRK